MDDMKMFVTTRCWEVDALDTGEGPMFPLVTRATDAARHIAGLTFFVMRLGLFYVIEHVVLT